MRKFTCMILCTAIVLMALVMSPFVVMAATKQAQDAWFASAAGRYMDPDGMYGYQCKDVADDYCIALFGNWQNTIRPGNGNEVFANANPDYFIKIANDPNDPNQIPQYGDIVSFTYNHVAVVVSATTSNMTVLQQNDEGDGSADTPCRIGTLSYKGIIGWLRPILENPVQNATADEVKQAYRDILEREADQDGLNHYVGNYTIEFVRNDLLSSNEYKQLQASKQHILGDLDNNKIIAANDALLVLEYSVGKISFDTFQTPAADVDGNGSITANDALLILEYSVGKISAFR